MKTHNKEYWLRRLNYEGLLRRHARERRREIILSLGIIIVYMVVATVAVVVAAL